MVISKEGSLQGAEELVGVECIRKAVCGGKHLQMAVAALEGLVACCGMLCKPCKSS